MNKLSHFLHLLFFNIKQIASDRGRISSIIISLTLTVGLLVSVMAFVDYNIEEIVEEKINELEIDLFVYPNEDQVLDSISGSIRSMTNIEDSASFLTFRMDLVPEGSSRNIFFELEATDHYNNTATLNNNSNYFSIPSRNLVDTSPPQYNINEVITSNSSALIQCTTDEPTYVTLEYASLNSIDLPDGGFGIHTGEISSGELQWNHSLIIDDLVPDTDYSVDASFENFARYTNTTGNNPIYLSTTPNVEADTTAPTLVNHSLAIVGDSSIKIEWETNEPTVSTIYYGTTNDSLTQQIVPDTVYSYHHSATLGPFSLDQSYYFQIQSQDAFNNIQNTTQSSDIFTITTSSQDTTVPTIEYLNWFIKYPLVIVKWRTNELTNGTVNFGYYKDEIVKNSYREVMTHDGYNTVHTNGLTQFTGYATKELASIEQDGIQRYNKTSYLKAGTFSLKNNGSIISDNIAAEFDLAVGDTFELSWIVYKQVGNVAYPKSVYYSFRVNAIAYAENNTLEGARKEKERGVDYYPLFKNNPQEIVVDYHHALSILTEIAEFQGDQYIPGGVPRSEVLGDRFVYVWVERNKVVRPDNLKASIRTLKNLKGQIELRTTPLASQSPLETELRIIQSQIFFDRFFFLVFSVPTIGLTWYVTQYAANVSLTDKKEDIGLLKTKGVTFYQLITLVGTEVAVIAAIGTALGVGIGLMNGWLMQTIVEFFTFNLSLLETVEPLITPLTAAIGLFYALIITIVGIGIPTLLLSRRYVIKILKSDYNETSRISKIFQRIRVDIILFVSGLLLMLLVLSQGGLIAMVNPILEWLILLSPLILALGSIGIIGRLLPFLASPLMRVFRPFIGDISGFIKKQMTRRLHHSSSVMGVILITVMLGVYTSISAHSIANARINDEVYNLGGEIVIQPKLSRTLGSLNLSDVRSNIKDIDGIKEVSVAYYGKARLGVGVGSEVPVMYVDPNTFPRTAFLESNFVKSNDINESIEGLRDNSIIISQGIQDDYALSIGDEMNISLMFGGIASKGLPLQKYELEISDLATLWPTFRPNSVVSGELLVYYYNEFIENSKFLILSTSFVDDARSKTGTNPLEGISFFAKTEPENTRPMYEIAYEIEQEYGGIAKITTAEETIEAAKNSKEVRSYYSILTINLIFALVVTIFAISSFLAHVIRQRRFELGILKAIGFSNNGVTAVVALETATLSFLGIILGFVIGYLTSFQMLKIISFSFALPIHQVLAWRDFVIIFILTTIAVVLGTWWPIRKVRELEVMEVMAVD